METTTKNAKVKTHTNYNAADYAYLQEKGYSDAEILAIWDRDAALGKPAQEHTHNPNQLYHSAKLQNWLYFSRTAGRWIAIPQ